MKKVISILVAICILSVSWVLCVSAISLKNGQKYEVPITLIHAEKDKTSMGDRYIYNTALIEVEGKTKYLTMVTDSSVSNLNFWYYNDGSVSGNTTDAQKVSDVEIGGKTYSVGYRFPLCGDEQLVGVKFSASIMPMTPSARVKIDYDNVKEVTSTPKATEAPTTQPTTQTVTTEATTSKAIETTATETTTEPTVVETTSAPIQTQPETVAPSAADYAAVPVMESATPTSIKVTIECPAAIPISAVLILISVAILLICCFKEGSGKND